ncbi:hypothetical protein [Nubsella zeaxanthinifaciens]|uniref:hypothetical protein n=1 Tax=Nubsella zeaxanthinifaciens TaxID=392412 RepID=UPI000DE38AEC|nr:hypothetical protein [Nubsella zeaxanthinifaciens]
MATKLENEGKFLDRATIKSMVDAYREKNKQNVDALKYAHFKIEDILQLCVNNKILPETVLTQIEKPTDPKAKGYGLKIYLGIHLDGTYPSDKPDYKGATTTILCNTQIIEGKGFKDMLKHTDPSILNKLGDDEGTGLDRAEIEPPYHDNGGEDYDIGE